MASTQLLGLFDQLSKELKVNTVPFFQTIDLILQLLNDYAKTQVQFIKAFFHLCYVA